MQDLGTMGGFYCSAAYGINARGQIVGLQHHSGAGDWHVKSCGSRVGVRTGGVEAP